VRFSVGYQARDRDDFITAIIEEKAHIAEVYFAYPGIANGRAQNLSAEKQAQQDAELKAIASNGIPTNLLLNAMCYGKDAQSRDFFQRIGDTFDTCAERYGTVSVTTTSPLIGKFIHDNFPGVKVRASVNMELGSVRAMETVADYFDGFYAKREYSRNPEALTAMKEWCDANGKTLHLLANSGCVSDCGMHVFHDNLVAHESEIAQQDNAYSFSGTCWDTLKNPAKQPFYLRNATFIRPEDLHLYEKWFSVTKLATRVNRNPVAVLKAYSKGSFRGSLPSLMEPNHEGAFLPNLLENSLIPTDFGEKVLHCGQKCENCTYCENAFKQALISLT